MKYRKFRFYLWETNATASRLIWRSVTLAEARWHSDLRNEREYLTKMGLTHTIVDMETEEVVF